MARLISSRLHRCYSRNGVQRSARIENLSTIIHVTAIFALLFARDFSPLLPTRPTFTIPPFFVTLTACVLLLIHLLDFYAAYAAHHKIYRFSKTHKKPVRFLSTPTKIDCLIVSFHLLGTFTLLVSASGIAGPSWTGPSIPPSVNACFCLFSLFAVTINLILSLPSLDFGVPTALARAQNTIVTLFCMATLIKLQAILLPFISDLSASTQDVLARCLFASDLTIFGASLINVIRVSKFLSTTRYWAMEEVRTDQGRTNRQGLLSWFKTSRATADGSDIDSDDLDEDYFDIDDEEWQKSSRRAAL